MRGRIINPFVAVLAQLDTQASTYDATRREPTVSYDRTTGERKVNRGERQVSCVCQVETGMLELQQMGATGNVPLSQMTLIFHYEHLEEAGLLGPDNRPLINVNDRLVRLENTDNSETATSFDRSPLYVTESRPVGYGFGGRVNLLQVSLSDRPQGVRGQ